MGISSLEGTKKAQPLLSLDALLISGIIKAYHSLTLTVRIMNTYCTDKNLYLLCALGSLSHEHFCYRAVPKHIKFKA